MSVAGASLERLPIPHFTTSEISHVFHLAGLSDFPSSYATTRTLCSSVLNSCAVLWLPAHVRFLSLFCFRIPACKLLVSVCVVIYSSCFLLSHFARPAKLSFVLVLLAYDLAVVVIIAYVPFVAVLSCRPLRLFIVVFVFKQLNTLIFCL